MKIKNMALIVAVAGIAILLFGLLTPTTSGDSGGGMNGGSDSVKTSYTMNNAVLIMIGAFVSAVGLSYWAFKEDYVPVAVDKAVPVVTEKVKEEDEENVDVPREPEEVKKDGGPSIGGEKILILRLLNGDERHMFRTIVDLGGEALQKDLIVKTKMSDAKVSRVIDRLIEKGLVTKERHGVTNKVRISVEK